MLTSADAAATAAATRTVSTARWEGAAGVLRRADRGAVGSRRRGWTGAGSVSMGSGMAGTPGIGGTGQP